MKKETKKGVPPPGKRIKLYRIMRLTAYMVVLFHLSLSATGFSQEEKFSIRGEVTIKEIFEEIARVSNLRFFYNNEFDASRRVSLDVREATIDEVMRRVLTGQPYSYALLDDYVIIRHDPGALLQQRVIGRRISGVVRDERGAAFPGVTVQVKGSNAGVITDKDGRYAITLPGGSATPDVLIFSYMGMKRQEVTVTAERTTYDVAMVEEVKSIQEVVVTGYQSIRASEMVGSSNTVKREELFYDGTNSIEQMLQGALPGMLVMNTDGLVGTRQKVRVRGTSTLLGNQEPVWVVDGIIQEDPLPFKAQELDSFDPDNFDMIRDFVGSAIAWLNPNDIEDITILKDAAATVMYGVKAANGVIVIATKKGEAGRASINYNGGASVSSKLTYAKMNLMNSEERIDVSREIYERRLYGARPTENVGYELLAKRYINKEISYAEFDAGVKALAAMNTDWLDLLYRNPVSQNHSLSFSGGSEKVTYYASLNARKTIGTARGNNSESYGASANIDSRLSEQLSAGIRLNANIDNTSSFYTVDPYTYATRTSRAIPHRDAQGDLFYYTTAEGYLYNVTNELNNTGNANEKRSFGINMNIQYTPLQGVRLQSLFGLSASTTNGESYASERTFFIAQKRGYEFNAYGPTDAAYKASRLPHGGELNTMESRNTSVTWRNAFSFDRVYGERHRVGFMLGEEIRSTLAKGTSSTVYGYFPDRGKSISLPQTTITNASGELQPNSIYESMTTLLSESKSNVFSLYSNLAYSFDERYVWSGSVRWDASNRFGQDKRSRFLPVWSMGARWNAHNEPWLRNSSLLSELNLRFSYGWQGNVAEGVGPDLILKIPSTPVDAKTGEMMLNIKSLPYADLRWEKTRSYNLGLDVGLFKNRFMLSAEVYRKHTEDAIIYEELPLAYGIESMPVNGGKLLNEGVELQVRGTLVRTRDFVWNLSVNTSRNRNRVDSDIDHSAQWQYARSGNLNKKGYPVSAFWAFRFTGLNGEYGYPEFHVPTPEENPAAITDVTEYMEYAGDLTPDFEGGISTTIRYKTLSLSSSFNLNAGGKKFLSNMFTRNSLPSAYDNLPKEFVDRWRKPGDEAYTTIPGIPGDVESAPGSNSFHHPRATLPTGSYESLYAMYNYSTARVVNASFLRCNAISLAYSLPVATLSKTPLKNVLITASVSNPFIIVSKDFKGMDPEVATGKQPISQTYSLNVNVSF
ncbi:MAG: SusC/RagA family TonB-linked outer membrane protein [Odoribacteraceae bacterium]|jgi:TonB-linked SusC/RagA family outer membrane protein|nr:SusC/RagA family TonB-linked outer membrane protein [Odoribacteraceae bacterium]